MESYLMSYEMIETPGKPIKAWIAGLARDEAALQQVRNVSMLPFVEGIALMPDYHFGMGSTIGCVVATKGVIVPSITGVDIGCGMMAVKTPLHATHLPDNLADLRDRIERAVPHGRTNDGKEGDRGAWHDIPPKILTMAMAVFMQDYFAILQKHPKIETKRVPWHHMGTLGTGNHFIELCLDQNQAVWIMLHSGSRGVGNRIGTYFIEKAKEEMLKYHINEYLPDQDLSYLVEKSDLYGDYLFAVNWAQKFAAFNRRIMMDNVWAVLSRSFPGMFTDQTPEESAINCHHNYVAKENHFGSNVWITRKGAVRAREGDLGIIPGSMGAKSFIVRGKGNAESFNSCSHGAGRAMSRNQAKKRFTVEDHIKATEGVECRKDAEVVDETPMAYKDIDAVMRSQADLVDIVYTLKQVVCVKG
jgi:tRNA-splicing ligase RtcB